MKKFLLALPLSFLLVGSSHSQESFSYYILNQELKVLSATGEETRLSEVPRYTLVITREEIDRLGAKNLFDLLDKLPEFYVWRSFFGLRAVGALGVRQSYFSEKVQVLIDGMPTLDPSNGSAFSTNNNYSLDNVKQVEIIYGPMTSLYGFNASLAVINLVTYSPDEVNLELRSSVSTGADGDVGVVKSFSYKGFKGVISVNYNRWNTPHGTYTDYLNYSGVYSPYSRHATYYIKLNHESGFFLRSYGVSRHDRFPVSISHFFSGGDHTYADREAFLNQVGYRGSAGRWNYTFTAGLNFLLLKRGYNLCPKNHQVCNLLPYGFYGIEKRYVREPSLSLKVNTDTDYGKLLLGVDYSEADLYKTELSATFYPSALTLIAQEVEHAILTGTHVDPVSIASKIKNFPMRKLPDDETLIAEKFRSVFSPYLQYFYSNDGTSYLFNVRWDKTNDAGKAVSASFSYMKSLSDNLKFKLNCGRAVRVPSFEEMYVRNNTFLIGNPNLKLEKEDSIMPSLEYSGESLYFSGFVYFSWFRDFIYKRRVSLLTWMWDNSESTVRIRGASFTVKKRLDPDWEVSLSLNRRFSLKGLNSEYLEFPKTKFVGSVTYSRGALEVNLTTVAYSRVSSAPGFYRADLNINYSLSDNFTLNVQVRNLTDKDYIYPNGVPGDERTLWLGLRYSY